MKKYTRFLCLLLIFCLSFSLFAACNGENNQQTNDGQVNNETIGNGSNENTQQPNGDNQNSDIVEDDKDPDEDNQSSKVFRQVSEEIWNEQIASLSNLSNFTFSIDFPELDWWDREPFMMKFTDGVSYLSDDNFSDGHDGGSNELYFFENNSSIVIYYRIHYSQNPWNKVEYSKDEFRFATAQEYFSAALGPHPSRIQEYLLTFNQSDFQFDDETGTYQLNSSNLVFEIKFSNNQLEYIKLWEPDYSDIVYLYTIYDIGTTNIDLPNFSE